MIIEGSESKVEIDIKMMEASFQNFKESEDNIIEIKAGKWDSRD